MAKSYFINNIDSYIGKEILAQLVGTEEEPSGNTIIGTRLDSNNHEKLIGMKKVLKRNKPLLFKKYLSEMDVLIYDTYYGDLNEVKIALEAFKKPKKEIENAKVLVLISSIRSWSANGKKIKAEPIEEKKADDGEENEDAEKADGDDGENEQKDTDENEVKDTEEKPEGEENANDDAKTQYDDEGNPIPKKNLDEEIQAEEVEEVEPEYEPWNDDDYKDRMPHERFLQIKELEDEVMSQGVEQVKTYIVCGGLIYGNGEDAFYELIKAAWRQQPMKLPYFNEGENLVPTVHVKDLVKFGLKISENPPENKPYHFCFDNTADRSQKSLISSQSTSVGSGGIQSIDTEENDLIPTDWQDMFKANLWSNNSSILRTAEIVDGEEAPPPDFEWHTEKGISACSTKILKEFVGMHSLKPVKIIVSGHDKSGKTFFSASLAEHYKIPVLSLKSIFEQFPPKNINAIVDEEGKEVIIDADFELVEDYKDLKDGVDGLLQKVLNGETKNLELDENSKVFFRILKWRLSQNDCINRGYVLDDPKLGINDLKTIFIDQKKKLRRIKPKPKKLKKKRKRIQKEENEEGDSPQKEPPVDDKPAEEEKPAEVKPEGDIPPVDVEQPPVDGNQIYESENQQDENGCLPGEEWVTEDAELAEDEEWVPEPEKVDGEGGEDGEEEAKQDGEAEEQADGEVGEDGEEENAGPKTENFLPESVSFQQNFKDNSSLNVETPLFAQTVNDFCELIDVETFNTDIRKKTQHEGLDTLRIFIERNGRPFNYLTDVSVLKEGHDKFYEECENARIEKIDKGKKSVVEKVEKAKADRLEKALKQVKFIEDNEMAELGVNNQAVRPYLTEMLEPILTDALLQVTKVIPNDPIEFLSNYINWRSFEF